MFILRLAAKLLCFNTNKNSIFTAHVSSRAGKVWLLSLTATLNPMWTTAAVVVQNILIKLFNTEIHTNGPLYSENNYCIYNNPQSDLTTRSIWRPWKGANGQKIHKQKKTLHCAILIVQYKYSKWSFTKKKPHTSKHRSPRSFSFFFSWENVLYRHSDPKKKKWRAQLSTSFRIST